VIIIAAGDVTVLGPFVATDKTSIDTALTAARASANDKWLSYPCAANQVMFVHIEEA